MSEFFKLMKGRNSYEKIHNNYCNSRLVHVLTCSTTFAQDMKINDTPVNIMGVSMSVDDFKDTFSGDPDTRKLLRATKSLATPEISIDNIVIDEENISFTAQIMTGDKITSLQMGGELRAGFKSQFGVNSIIVYVPESINGYSVLLFEIYNEHNDNNLLINTMTNEVTTALGPHIKIYLQDESGMIYLFEKDMPECFSQLNAGDYIEAPRERDLHWALHIAEGEMAQIEADEKTLMELGFMNQSRAVNQETTWVNNTIYQYSYYIGSNITYCYSLPCLNYKYLNLAGDTTWSAQFYIAEHVSSAGYTIYGGNVFEYRDLQISFACGDNTRFIKSEQYGRVYDLYASKELFEKDKFLPSLLRKVVNQLPVNSTYLDALGFINSMSTVHLNSDIYLGDAGDTNLENFYTVAAGEKLTKYSLDESTYHGGDNRVGHWFKYHVVAQYEDDNASTSSIGALVVSFNTYNIVDFSSTPVSVSFQLNYTTH